VRIDGNFQGNISSPGTLILGREAVVKGEIEVSSLNANGTIIGTVRASRHVHLHENAVVDGLLVTPALGMDDGAIINGTIEMNRVHLVTPPAEAFAARHGV
jgi:cytoskeletal protein CcmA (bactofilin family)